MREWSHNTLVFMLRRMRLTVNLRTLRNLSDSQWNELGDWAYLKVSGDRDHLPNRPEPAALRLVVSHEEADQANTYSPRRKIIERIKEIFDV